MGYFLPFYPPNNPKNQNFEKMKKPPGDIITLHMCTINDNHMMYGSCDMEHEGQNFLSFWTIFCTFTPLITQKVKTLKKILKTPGDIITLQMCTMNDNHMMYEHLEILSLYTCVLWMTITWCIVPEIWSVTDGTFCHFGPFFPFNPLNNLKIKNFEKMKKNTWRYYHFTHVYHKWKS